MFRLCIDWRFWCFVTLVHSDVAISSKYWSVWLNGNSRVQSTISSSVCTETGDSFMINTILVCKPATQADSAWPFLCCWVHYILMMILTTIREEIESFVAVESVTITASAVILIQSVRKMLLTIQPGGLSSWMDLIVCVKICLTAS